MGKTLQYVKEFDFSPAGKPVGYCSGGMAKKGGYAKGGAVKPQVKAMEKREMTSTPTMEKREVVERQSIKAPSAPREMLRDKSSLGIQGNVNPGPARRKMPVAPREPMVPLKTGGAVAKARGAKVSKVMSEYKAGELHSGKNGPVVKNPKQAVAIALSEARSTGKSKK